MLLDFLKTEVVNTLLFKQTSSLHRSSTSEQFSILSLQSRLPLLVVSVPGVAIEALSVAVTGALAVTVIGTGMGIVTPTVVSPP